METEKVKVNTGVGMEMIDWFNGWYGEERGETKDGETGDSPATAGAAQTGKPPRGLPTIRPIADCGANNSGYENPFRMQNLSNHQLILMVQIDARLLIRTTSPNPWRCC